MSMQTKLQRAVAHVCRRSVLARSIASSSHVRKVSEFAMPAMSPTMTSGKISSWKVKEGDSFSAGDVLLTVETDKAEVDVEAQDDGIVGKIIVDENVASIDVGKTIALLAEEGDDISNLEIPKSSGEADFKSATPGPKESQSSAASASPTSSSSKQQPTADKDGVVPQKSSSHATSSPNTDKAPQSENSGPNSHSHTPQHARPLLPSVLRLLAENGIKDASKIEATGRRGQLLKGDVLKHLGKVSHPDGSAEKLATVTEHVKDMSKVKKAAGAGGASKSAPQKPMTGDELRRWIRSGMAVTPKATAAPVSAVTFDEVLDGYVQSSGKLSTPTVPIASGSSPKNAWDQILGL